VKIGRSTTELLRIFDFNNGGCPPSWIWYDVIADHPRLVFDGPNILLKLHVHRDNKCFARYRDFYIWPVGLEIAYSPHFGEFGEYDVVPLGTGYRRKGSKNYSAGATRWSKTFWFNRFDITGVSKTPSQPASHLSMASTALASVARVKTKQ